MTLSFISGSCETLACVQMQWQPSCSKAAAVKPITAQCGQKQKFKKHVLQESKHNIVIKVLILGKITCYDLKLQEGTLTVSHSDKCSMQARNILNHASDT